MESVQTVLLKQGNPCHTSDYSRVTNADISNPSLRPTVARASPEGFRLPGVACTVPRYVLGWVLKKGFSSATIHAVKYFRFCFRSVDHH